MNSRINDAIETASNERVLPRIQNIANETLNKERGNGTIPDEARINRDVHGREPEICHNSEVNSEGEDNSPDTNLEGVLFVFLYKDCMSVSELLRFQHTRGLVLSQNAKMVFLEESATFFASVCNFLYAN